MCAARVSHVYVYGSGGAGGGTLGVRVAGHVTASGPLGTWVQTMRWGDQFEETPRSQVVAKSCGSFGDLTFQTLFFTSFGPIGTVEM